MTLHHRGLDAFLWEAEKDKGSETPPTPADTTVQATETPAGRIEDLPEFAQAIIKDLRRESATRRKALDDAEKAAGLVADAKLAEQNEWKTLAEQRAAKVAELEPQTAKLAAYEKLLGEQLDAELKAWPKEVLELAPVATDTLTRLEWVNRSRPLAARLMATPPANGNGPGPKPAYGIAGKPVTTNDVAKSYIDRTYGRKT
jgi:hypothetical protein